MNYCTACKQDFGSVSGFDAHRVGKHAYTYSEGIQMEPMREDGRRCLTSTEMAEKGWNLDSHHRWRLPSDEKALARLGKLRSAAPTGSKAHPRSESVAAVPKAESASS